MLVDRVQRAISASYDGYFGETRQEAKAAITEVAKWLRDNYGETTAKEWARHLEQEVAKNTH